MRNYRKRLIMGKLAEIKVLFNSIPWQTKLPHNPGFSGLLPFRVASIEARC